MYIYIYIDMSAHHRWAISRYNGAAARMAANDRCGAVGTAEADPGLTG